MRPGESGSADLVSGIALERDERGDECFFTISAIEKEREKERGRENLSLMSRRLVEAI